jgi:Zn-dependent protease
MTEKISPVRSRSTGIVLGRLFGIEIRLDMSVLIIFLLVAFSLGQGLFPSWHPDWGAVITWACAIGAALVFFLSLLLHELSHSLVARTQGIDVPRITLFLFGGMAEMASEPRTPRAEFLVAIVGPLASLALALLFGTIGSWLTPAGFAELLLSEPEQAMSALGPVATVCVWLAPVNLALAIFNLVPGFPLDGGRVLRAFLWWLTGDLLRATRLASISGRVFAGALMVLGVLNLIWGRAVEGIWFLVIGWFLGHVAETSYQQLLLRSALRGLLVGDLMRTHFETTNRDERLDDFIETQLLRSSQALWPVVAGNELVGYIAQTDIVRRAEADRVRMTVGDVMRPATEIAGLSPQLTGPEAFERLAQNAEEPLPVIDHGVVVGLVHAADIFRYLAMHRMRLTP